MHTYEVYATRWDDPHIVEQIPARNLEFSMPLSDHGEASFSATVEPGWVSWRSSLTKDLSGILIARDGVPFWQGWVVEDRESGPRTFSFRALEWGYFFTACPPPPRTWTNTPDPDIFRDLIDRTQAISGQNVAVQTVSTYVSVASDLTTNVWDETTAERVFRTLSEPENGPEWYFGTNGTLDNPIRQLYLGNPLGNVEPAAFLEYVEATVAAQRPGGIPTVTLLGSLYPGASPVVPTRRAGGNVIAKARTRQGDSATVAVATGSGTDVGRLVSTATSTLIGKGWPRMTRTTAYSDEKVSARLQRHANADLAKAQGFATGYSLVTLDGDPDWTDVPRGSMVTVSLDTDIYGGPRPLEFNTRLLNLAVRVPDDGPAQVQWDTATVQEY